MLPVSRHDVLPIFLVVLAAQCVLPFLLRLVKVHERTLDQFDRLRHVVPPVGSIPQAALEAIHAVGAALPGFSHLGILTVEPSQSAYAFTGVFVDDATRSTVAQAMFVQTTFASPAHVVVLVATYLGDGADPRVVGLSNARSGALVSGRRPGTSRFALPGADPATLLALHRRQLMAERLPRLQVVSLEQALRVFDHHNLLERAWWLSSGRMTRDRSGHLRLSWQQCVWWAARTGKAGKSVYARRVAARTREAEDSWPKPPRGGRHAVLAGPAEDTPKLSGARD